MGIIFGNVGGRITEPKSFWHEFGILFVYNTEPFFTVKPIAGPLLRTLLRTPSPEPFPEPSQNPSWNAVLPYDPLAVHPKNYSVDSGFNLFRVAPVRFGYGLGIERFERFWFSVPAVPLRWGVFVCFSTVSQRGRFWFRFRFLENGSGGSGSAFGSCENRAVSALTSTRWWLLTPPTRVAVIRGAHQPHTQQLTGPVQGRKDQEAGERGSPLLLPWQIRTNWTSVAWLEYDRGDAAITQAGI